MKRVLKWFFELVGKRHTKDNSYSDNGTKIYLSQTESLTISAKSQENIEQAKKNIEDICNSCAKNPQKLIDYINTTETKIYYINNAKKLLRLLNEDEGFITELRGFKALILGLITEKRFTLKTIPMFIFENKTPNDYIVIYNFYKWYSCKMNLPGYEYNAQENFKKYMKNLNHPDFKKLNLQEMTELENAIARDKEANNFVIDLLKKFEGGKNACQKMQNGGADV